MKKMIALLVVFSFALVPFNTFAATDPFDPDYVHSFFGTYSIDDLLNMQKLIEIELEYRGHSCQQKQPKEFDVPAGKYTIGVDIPAGVYTISRGGGMFDAIIVIGNYDAFYPVSHGSPVGKLELVEGQTVEIQLGSVIFSEYKGIGF